MSRVPGTTAFLRRAAATAAALLLSVPLFAAFAGVQTAPCCRPAGAPAGCCADGDVSAALSAKCCLMTAPEEAAPSVRSSAPVLAAPPASLEGLPATLTASLAGPTRRVVPCARPAPLFLLFAALLV